MCSVTNPTDTDYMFDLIANPAKVCLPPTNINSLSSDDKTYSEKSRGSIKSNNSIKSIKSNARSIIFF